MPSLIPSFFLYTISASGHSVRRDAFTNVSPIFFTVLLHQITVSDGMPLAGDITDQWNWWVKYMIGCLYWCFTSHATIFQLYMGRHRCTGGLKKLYLRLDSQRHTHSYGSLTCPSKNRHMATLLKVIPPHLVEYFTTRWGYGGPILILTPGSHGDKYMIQIDLYGF